MASNTEFEAAVRKVSLELDAVDNDNTLTAEKKKMAKALYIKHFASPEVREVFEKHFHGVLEPIKGKVWIDPNSHALAFLKKYEKPDSSSNPAN